MAHLCLCLALLLLLLLPASAALPLTAFRLENNTFCTLDHNQPATVATSAAACAATVPASAFGFQWEPFGKACVVFGSAADCGRLEGSSCGSQVFINASLPPPPPPVKPVYNLAAFEAMVPAWVQQYKLPGSAANFSFQPGGTVPHPYASDPHLTFLLLVPLRSVKFRRGSVRPTVIYYYILCALRICVVCGWIY